MQEGVRKWVMLGVIAACVGGAGVITYSNMRGGEPDFRPYENQSRWVKCRNSACDAAYEMNLARYYEYVYKNTDYGDVEPAALKCKVCGKPSVYEAVKCGNCGEIFERGTVYGDFWDRCPECGYSETEVKRRQAAEARQAWK
jgi:hypothetical protein